MVRAWASLPWDGPMDALGIGGSQPSDLPVLSTASKTTSLLQLPSDLGGATAAVAAAAPRGGSAASSSELARLQDPHTATSFIFSWIKKKVKSIVGGAKKAVKKVQAENPAAPPDIRLVISANHGRHAAYTAQQANKAAEAALEASNEASTAALEAKDIVDKFKDWPPDQEVRSMPAACLVAPFERLGAPSRRQRTLGRGAKAQATGRSLSDFL